MWLPHALIGSLVCRLIVLSPAWLDVLLVEYVREWIAGTFTGSGHQLPQSPPEKLAGNSIYRSMYKINTVQYIYMKSPAVTVNVLSV